MPEPQRPSNLCMRARPPARTITIAALPTLRPCLPPPYSPRKCSLLSSPRESPPHAGLPGTHPLLNSSCPPASSFAVVTYSADRLKPNKKKTFKGHVTAGGRECQEGGMEGGRWPRDVEELTKPSEGCRGCTSCSWRPRAAHSWPALQRVEAYGRGSAPRRLEARARVRNLKCSAELVQACCVACVGVLLAPRPRPCLICPVRLHRGITHAARPIPPAPNPSSLQAMLAKWASAGTAGL